MSGLPRQLCHDLVGAGASDSYERSQLCTGDTKLDAYFEE